MMAESRGNINVRDAMYVVANGSDYTVTEMWDSWNFADGLSCRLGLWLSKHLLIDGDHYPAISPATDRIFMMRSRHDS